ncbi:MAG TPA: glycosyltransferase family 9 protein, partial [Candidatus Eisenbacteria bacterium]|nr:glycosyltransferase family 9 protein [Candidatus Eisenbacteria bacterium]
GGVPDGGGPRVALAPAAHAAALALLARAGVIDPAATIGLVAAGSWPTKTWPPAYAAALARGLMANGHPVLLLAGPGEQHVSETITRLAAGVIVLPPCDVGTLAAVIASLRAVVGNDSGPRHLAAAFDVPTYAWFGPTHPDTWATPGARHAWWWTSVPCRGCDRTACPHWNCMPELEPRQALARVRAHLANSPARAGRDDGAAAGLRARAGA